MDHPSTYRVVYVEPGKPACEKEIGSDLKSLQEAVGGGLIELVYPHRDNTLIVCNDEGKLIGMEQIRVIKEMREADIQRGRTAKYIRPRFGIWENVPGALSSGTPKTEDFRIVLEEFLRIGCDSISVPEPYTGRWEPAGRVLLGDSLSLAWRILDTQYWPGTPQRRRRIYLVVDFGGQSAPQILFDQESLCRDYSAFIRTGQAVTADTSKSTGAAGWHIPE